MPRLTSPETVVDSVAKGALSIVQFFPRTAENIAAVATSYAARANRDLESIKASMPRDPKVLADVALDAIGETANAGIGLVESVLAAGAKTADDIRMQTKRVLS